MDRSRCVGCDSLPQIITICARRGSQLKFWRTGAAVFKDERAFCNAVMVGGEVTKWVNHSRHNLCLDRLNGSFPPKADSNLTPGFATVPGRTLSRPVPTCRDTFTKKILLALHHSNGDKQSRSTRESHIIIVHGTF
jgi:hypothetical protein